MSHRAEHFTAKAFSAFSPEPSPKVLRSRFPGFTLVEPPSISVLREVPVPPWQQPVQLVFGSGSPLAGVQCSDFWSNRMRCSVVRSFFPSKGRSKVASSFHSHEKKQFVKKLTRKAETLMRTSSVSRLPELKPHIRSKVQLSLEGTHLTRNSSSFH